jgi:hypothetical protein
MLVWLTGALGLLGSAVSATRTAIRGSEAATILYSNDAIAAPMSGATMNSQSWLNAHPPTNTAGPILRAGLTEVLVTGIPTKWIKTSTIPIGIPANPTGALISVVPNTVKTRKNVNTTSATNVAVRL